jgi:glycosyltransferase involved in cell wall biosynthesis
MYDKNKIEISKLLPFISIIIPAYNESKFIEHCLKALQDLNYPQELYEIIIVDNGSSDDTVSIGKRYTQKIYICRGVNISALRNYGAKKAAGDIYAFIDADCIPAKNWLLSAVKLLAEDWCITGSKVKIPPGAGWIERAWFYGNESGRKEVRYINSANMIVPAEIFKRIGGFNESLRTGEDSEFCIRARRFAKIISDGSIEVVHLGNPRTLGQFFKREIWHGLGAFGTFKIKWFDKPLIGTFLFLSLTLFEGSGILYAIFLGNGSIVFYSSLGIILLILATVYNRLKTLSATPMTWLKLILLYYLYFLGRTISLFVLLIREKRVLFLKRDSKFSSGKLRENVFLDRQENEAASQK